MQVIKLSEKKQEFQGKVYYLCGNYFQRDGIRLHREVWKSRNGKIPKGYAVHHIDEDRANNDISNLDLLLRSEHTSLHQKGHNRPFSQNTLDVAAKWHGSADGIEWHKQHYEDFKDRLHRKAEFVCEFCGKKYVAEIKKENRFCSNNCKSAWRRKAGLDNIEKICLKQI